MIGGDLFNAIVLDAAVKGTVVLILAGAVSLAFRWAPASFRHLVWSLALGAVLLLPALTPLLPRWSVRGLPSFSAERPEVVESGPVSVARESRSVAATVAPLPRERGAERAAPIARADRRLAGTAGPVAGERLSVSELAEGRTRAGLPWGTVLPLVWLTGALVVLAGIALGVARTRQLAGRARPLTSSRLKNVAAQLAAELGLSRRVVVLQCRGSCMPMTWGLVWPRLLVPAEAEDWSDDLLRAVILHELAHVRRFDYVTQQLARLACAIHWFNPLVWMAARRLRIEREMACDDEVLQAGSRASDYAGHLLDVALSLRRRPLLAAVAMARASHLSDRVRAVLDARRARGSLTPGVATSTTLAAALVVLTVAAASPAQSATVPREGNARPAPRLAGSLDRERVPPVRERAARDRPTAARPVGAADARLVAVPAVSRSAGAVTAARAALCDWMARDDWSRLSMEADDDDLRLEMRRGDCELNVDVSGEVTFNAEETEVVALSPGGELKIEEKRGRASRRLKMEADRSGNLERRWWVDRDEQPYDAEARAWLGDMILVLFRRAGIQAQARAERILARDGVDGLLQEISYIPGDYVAGRYYGVLLSQADLDQETVRRVVRRAAADINSDYELARILIAVAENHPLDETVQIAYVEAAGSIDSDFEQRRVLSAIMRREGLSPEVARVMLQAAVEIDSDFELASLLTDLAERYPLDREIPASYVAAAKSIESDYELARVLDKLVERGDLSSASLSTVLEAAEEIDSDYELSRLLQRVARDYAFDDLTRPAFFRAADSVEADFERARVLSAVLKSEPLAEADVEAVLESALEIDSDHELAVLLVELVRSYPLNDRLRPAFMRAVDTIESRFERERVLSAAFGQPA
ncbi:MAG: M56 family metallopeptidase [Gemmatimonadota bacterium]|nr:MAG: M56 family metallopeptidase [Gemmatimonadota bacterium]